MFDIGWQELFVLAVLAIIVIGPKDLPRAIKAVTHWIRKARGMTRDLQDSFDDLVQESELSDIKKQANSIMDGASDPTGAISRELDMSDESRSWAEAVDALNNSTDPVRDSDTSDAQPEVLNDTSASDMSAGDTSAGDTSASDTSTDDEASTSKAESSEPSKADG